MRRLHQAMVRAGPGIARGIARGDETGLLSYTDAQLAALTGRLAGSVQVPGAPGYNDDRMVFMHSYQHYPQLIVHCVVESDVVAALGFARETGLKATCRSGGHSTAGYSVNDQLVIDVGGIDHVLIDRDARVARVGAGATFRKLNLMLDAAGLHVPGGGCETVGVAGYMQGGGYGFTSRLYGMNCDNVRAVTLVLADGAVVRASAENERDLHWAVRGGTGNQFGVLVEIEYDLREMDTLFGFGLNWRLETAAEVETVARVLATYQAAFTKAASPKAMGLQALLMCLPTTEAPQGQVPQLLIRGVYDGAEAGCREALAPLIALMADPEKQIEIWEEGRYLHLNEILLLTANPPGLDLPTVSMNTKPLVDGRIVHDLHGPEPWRRVLELFLRAPDKTSFLGIEAYGGAINARAPDFNAYVHRDDSIDLFAWAFWTFDAHERAARDWLAEFGEVAGAMSDGRRYQNYPLRGDHDFRRAYFGANLERLEAIKARVDPDNLFAFEQSLAPAPAPATKTAAA